ncbi:MAG: tRNA epoxyqueuosine(34) reductase QueG [Gemmataceae bacterium]
MSNSVEEYFKTEAQRIGFALSGIAPATPADGFQQFQAWVAAGYAGEMAYLSDHPSRRESPTAIVPEAQSVIMLGWNYSGQTIDPEEFRIAKYAAGADYHDIIRPKLNTLCDWLSERFPESRSRGIVDTAPLLERDFARRAGLGWIGKNTLLIHKHRGSFLFLAAIVTTVALTPDAPHQSSHCGTCRACLDACPTGAFPQPHVLDARRCISYLTIELKGSIPLELRSDMGDWLYGCDVCQDVCPWNRHAAADTPAEPFPLSLAAILQLTDADFRVRFRGTVFFRLKRRGLVRNALIVLGNVGTPEQLSFVEPLLTDPEPIVAEAAVWAQNQIQRRNPLASKPHQPA